MESLSFESTIESPTKPHQEKLPDKNNKSMFLVQTISETDIPKQDIRNLENNESKENNSKYESQINELKNQLNEEKNKNQGLINEMKNKYESKINEMKNQLNIRKQFNRKKFGNTKINITK